MNKQFEFDGEVYDVEYILPTVREFRSADESISAKQMEARALPEGSDERQAAFREANMLHRNFTDSQIISINGGSFLDVKNKHYQDIVRDITGNG